MTGHHLKQTDYATVPWKNGRGHTLVLATDRSEAGSNKGSFRWRISIADMVEDAVFSEFPGIDRILTVIVGKGLTLHNSEQRFDCAPWQPVSFSGDLKLEGKLAGGPVKNFNVMVDPRCCSAEIKLLELDQVAVQIGGDGIQVFLYALDTVELDGGQSMTIAQGESFLGQQGHCYKVLKQPSQQCRVIVVSLKNAAAPADTAPAA